MLRKLIRELREEREYIRALPKLTRNEFNSWPDPRGEVRGSKSEKPKPKQKAVMGDVAPRKGPYFVIVRHSDQKVWCGPWKYDGERFSSVPKNWCLYRERDAAQSAIDWSTWDFRVDIEEFESL